MNVFGHIGISLAVAYAVENAVRRTSRRVPMSEAQLTAAPASSELRVPDQSDLEGPRFSLDHRAVVFGSMLPDIIDKPLALLIAPELVNQSTRNFAHTALFALVLVAVGLWWLRRTRSTITVAMGIASAGHLLFDQMWARSETLLWPILGLQFEHPVGDIGAWSRSLLTQLYTSPWELIGALSLIYLTFRVVHAHAIRGFMRSGRIP